LCDYPDPGFQGNLQQRKLLSFERSRSLSCRKNATTLHEQTKHWIKKMKKETLKVGGNEWKNNIIQTE